MIRRLFNVASVLSLLLCVAIVFLWLSGDILGWEGVWEHQDGDRLGNSHWQVDISGGGVCVSEFRMRVIPDGTAFAANYRRARRYPPEHYWRHKLDNDYPDVWQGASARWALSSQSTREGSSLVTQRSLILPCWPLAIATLILPIDALRREYVRRRVRMAANLCQQCGYDLRASTDRCSECGTPIPSRQEYASLSN